MEVGSVFVFYTFAIAGAVGDDRWIRTGIDDVFFGDEESARRALLEVQSCLRADPDVNSATMILEKVCTIAVTKAAILSLLNEGPLRFIRRTEIIEIIEA